MGEPLRINYGERSCASWLAQYGFLPEDAAEESEVVALELPLLFQDLNELDAAVRRGRPAAADPAAASDNEGASEIELEIDELTERVLESLEGESARLNCSEALTLPRRRLTQLLVEGSKDSVAVRQARTLHACFRVAFIAGHWREFAAKQGLSTFQDLIFVLDAGEQLIVPQAEAFAKRKGSEALKAKAQELLRLSQAAAPAGAPANWWRSVQRCAERQGVLLNIWGTWVATASLPSADSDPQEGVQMSILTAALSLAATVTALSMVFIGWLRGS